MRNIYGIVAVAVLLVVCVWYAWAGTITPLKNLTWVNVYGDSDTIITTGWTKISAADRDSSFKWIVQATGTVRFAVKTVVRINGVVGDSLTRDSTSVTAGTERLVTYPSGDSLMDQGWKQWTNYSASAREYLKAASTIEYQLCVVVLAATNAASFTISRYTD